MALKSYLLSFEFFAFYKKNKLKAYGLYVKENEMAMQLNSLLKKFNKRSIVLIKGKNGYISFDRDLQILKYIKFEFNYAYCNLNYLDKYNVNYIVLDNLDVVIGKKYKVNNYMKYLKLSYLYKILMVITK